MVIDELKKELGEWQAQLEDRANQLNGLEQSLQQREGDLSARENSIQVARQLQTMRLDFDIVLPFVEILNEIAQVENIDINTATKLARQELFLNRQFGGIRKEIEMAQAQLQVLDMTITEKQKPLETLAELQNKGVSIDAIYGLSKILDLDRLGKEWTPFDGNGNGNGFKTAKPVGNSILTSFENGSKTNQTVTENTGLDNDGNKKMDWHNLSIEDLVKMNLLK